MEAIKSMAMECHGVSPIPSTTSFSCHVDLPIACWPPLYDGMSNNKRRRYMSPLRWGHNDHDNVSNHQPHGCLLNRLFRRTSKKTSKLRVTGLCAGNSPRPVNSPHKGPVTRKMFPFDDVIMPMASQITDNISLYMTLFRLTTKTTWNSSSWENFSLYF